MKIIKKLWNLTYIGLKHLTTGAVKLQLVNLFHWLRDRYTLEDNSQVTVYTRNPDLFPGYPLVQSLDGDKQRHVRVSVISTAWNEGNNAARFVQDLLTQTRLPDEIVIVDGGSTDCTFEILQKLAAKSPVPIKLITLPKANISQGRNQAVANASFPVIASADFGCVITPDWLENLIAPFEIDPDLQVSGGWFDALDIEGTLVSYPWLPDLSTLNPQEFLPSSRSLAFTKIAWETAGGYPEWLTRTGEDTYFDLLLKHSNCRWAFVPDARVEWIVPATSFGRWKKLYDWSIGSGEAGITSRSYRWMLRKIVPVFILLWLALIAVLIALIVGDGLFWGIIGVVIILGGVIWAILLDKQQTTLKYELTLLSTYIPQLLGWFRGILNRPFVDQRRMQQTKGVLFILSGVPIDDTGGGARCTQIALEFLRRNWLVVFINKFPKYETSDLDLDIRHPNLITESVEKFSLHHFGQRSGDMLAEKRGIGLIEFPLKDYISLTQDLHALGFHMIYDLLDDWQTSLGATWYSPEVEQEIVDIASSVIATAPALVMHLQKMTSKPVLLLPNAVNSYLFNPERNYLRPADLPSAAWVAIYVGALWGEWFDWELLVKVAQTYPEAAVVVVGDYSGQCQNPPPNLYFLGLRPQRNLSAYLAHAQVAIIPWKVNQITQTTSPLKVYEYLAMQKPVVAPDITPLQSMPGVFLATDNTDFVELVAQVQGTDLTKTAIANFVAANNWKARIDAILYMCEENRLQL